MTRSHLAAALAVFAGALAAGCTDTSTARPTNEAPIVTKDNMGKKGKQMEASFEDPNAKKR